MHGLVNKSSYPGIEVLDISKLLAVFRYLSKFVNRNAWDRYIKKIEINIYKDYGRLVNLDFIYSNIYIHQYALAFIMKLVIKAKSPKAMIYSDNASYSIAIDWARKNNITTIDYQHSLTSNLHILYTHPDSIDENSKSYLSEYIMSYGGYWSKYFSKNYKVFPVGSYNQELAVNQIQNVEKDPNTIIIVSDGIRSRKILIEIALFLSIKIPTLQIFFKLRSEEYKNWKNIYPEKIKKNKRVTFIDNNENSLHYYLKKSEYVIGISSTVLIEALPLSKVIIYKYGYSNEMKDIIEDDLAFEANDYNEIFEIIFNNHRTANISENFELFRPNTLKNIQSTISQLL